MFRFWEKRVQTPSDTAQEIAKALTNGVLAHRNLNGHGISEMSVNVRGVLVCLSWYTRGRPRSISIDGKESIPNGVDSRHIFESALLRSERLIEEDMNAVSKKLFPHKKEPSGE